jgi:hypothetical protein
MNQSRRLDGRALTTNIKCQSQNRNGRDHVTDGAVRRTILKWFLVKTWTGLIWLMIESHGGQVVYTAMGSRVPSKESNPLTSWKAGRLASQEGLCSTEFLSYSVLEQSLQTLFPFNLLKPIAFSTYHQV